MKILQTILLTRSRDYLHSNSLCGKQNSVEQQLSKIKSPVNGQNCHHETKHWQETLRVKQKSVEPTVRRRQYDDKKKLQSMHPPLVQCDNCNLTSIHSVIWIKQQNIFTRCLNQLSTVKRIFWWEFCSSVFFSDVGRKFLHVRAGAVACNTYQCSSLDKKKMIMKEDHPSKRRLFVIHW